MPYEDVKDIQSIDAEGTSILNFKPPHEKKLDRFYDDIVLNEDLNEVLEERNEIIGFVGNREKLDSDQIVTSKKEIIQNALERVSVKLKAQTVALFLFSKDGSLERAGIFGKDSRGYTIDENWYFDESYSIGESFTGKAASQYGRKYGEILYTQNLSEAELKHESWTKYSEKLGELKCAIAVPLNGRNKTFGVLRVINKQDSSNPLFSKSDVQWLVLLTNYIANTLSNFRRDVKIQVFQQVGHLFINSRDKPDYDKSIQIACQEVIGLLINNPDTAFKAGVLRIVDWQSNSLKFIADSLAHNVTERFDNGNIDIDSDRFAAQVLRTGEPAILQSIREEKKIVKFANGAWVIKNGLDSFGCFPLISKGETLGTFSLYAGLNYEFHRDSIIFVQSILDLVAAFIHRVQLEKIENQTTKDLLAQPGLETSQDHRLLDYTSEKKPLDIQLEKMPGRSKHDLLVRLNEKPMSSTELAEELACPEPKVRELLQHLYYEKKVNLVGKSVIYYVFPSLVRHRKQEISDLFQHNPRFTLTAKGYLQANPIVTLNNSKSHST
jgi:GAF domain